nr:5E5 antigen-like [Equus asinus]
MPRPFPPEEAWLRRVRRTSRAASARPQRELGFSFVPTERKVSTAAAKAGRQEGLRKAAGGGQFPEGTRGRETASPETPGLYRVTSGVRGRKDELGRRRRRGSPIQGAEGLGGVPPSGGASLRAGRRAQGGGRGRRAEGRRWGGAGRRVWGRGGRMDSLRLRHLRLWVLLGRNRVLGCVPRAPRAWDMVSLQLFLTWQILCTLLGCHFLQKACLKGPAAPAPSLGSGLPTYFIPPAPVRRPAGRRCSAKVCSLN